MSKIRGRGELVLSDGKVLPGNYSLRKRPRGSYQLIFYPDQLEVSVFVLDVVDFRDEDGKYKTKDIGASKIRQKGTKITIICDCILENQS